MSFSCDVNILLYASDSSSPVHEPARRPGVRVDAGALEATGLLEAALAATPTPEA